MRADVLDALRSLAAEQPLRVEVRGHCMSPHLLNGATLEVAPRKIYLPGDVVVFSVPGEPLRVHRVLGYRWLRSGWALVTKADNASGVDPPVVREQLLGRITGGDCAPVIFQVPLAYRLAAAGCFLGRAAGWFRRRVKWS